MKYKLVYLYRAKLSPRRGLPYMYTESRCKVKGLNPASIRWVRSANNLGVGIGPKAPDICKCTLQCTPMHKMGWSSAPVPAQLAYILRIGYLWGPWYLSIYTQDWLSRGLDNCTAVQTIFGLRTKICVQCTSEHSRGWSRGRISAPWLVIGIGYLNVGTGIGLSRAALICSHMRRFGCGSRAHISANT